MTVAAKMHARASLYSEVTAQMVAELGQGRFPWVQPWDQARCGCGIPRNAATGRAYSGINVLLLWSAAVAGGYRTQQWLTFRQALALGAHVRKGEKGIAVFYADRFTPRREAQRARHEDREARQIAFLKRFIVFNADQCGGLAEAAAVHDGAADDRDRIGGADALIAATGADVRIGGGQAFYAPQADFVQVPPRAAFHDRINWYRTALHELGHWTGHPSRLGREQSGAFGSDLYAREELVAEICSAFVCAALSIRPTVRHADYVGAWLEVLRADERAIFRAASQAARAAEWLLGFAPGPNVRPPGHYALRIPAKCHLNRRSAKK